MSLSPATLPSALVCAGCGASPEPDDPYPFRCPGGGAGDDADHVLRRILDVSAVRFPTNGQEQGDLNPYIRYRHLFHSHHVASAGGLQDAEYCDLVARLDGQVAEVDGHGFRITPFGRADVLSERLGFAPDGGVWVKDETGNVSGSHKARHLFGLLVHLAVVERLGRTDPGHRPHLAIASCGNAALAAAVVAAAGGRVLEVFVPVDADPVVVDRLKDLDARVTVCPREPGLPGDPTYHRLRRALAEGALPFTCQGSENGLAIESGFTLGYEMAEALTGGPPLDRLMIQVGGGALASACIEALGEATLLGALARVPGYHAVQTMGAWPLRRAFERVATRLPAGAGLPEVRAVLSYAATHRSEFMWPWEEEPRSIAHGILDDETYDWLAVVEGMLVSGGGPVVVSEDLLARANTLAVDATHIDVDPTGSSGLAGLLALRDQGAIGDHERVGVLLTGVRR
ncbi:MAG TPA: pyridoxal-phosphate dependent enzyme [Dermatophilaceae bacterium]